MKLLARNAKPGDVFMRGQRKVTRVVKLTKGRYLFALRYLIIDHRIGPGSAQWSDECLAKAYHGNKDLAKL